MTIPDAQFRVSTDSMVLADFCRDAGGRGLDLGCGCGTLGLCCWEAARPEVSAASRSSRGAARQAEENARQNGLTDRFWSSAEIFGRRTRRSRPGALILPSPIRRIIRRAAGGCGRRQPFARARASSAARSTRCAPRRRQALRWGGRLYLVHKPERLADLMVFLRAARLEPKRLRFVRHSAASAVSLVLLEARLGGSRGCRSSRSWSSTGRTAASLPRADAFTTDRSETDMAGMLYLVPTPIGNLSDISPAAARRWRRRISSRRRIPA